MRTHELKHAESNVKRIIEYTLLVFARYMYVPYTIRIIYILYLQTCLFLRNSMTARTLRRRGFMKTLRLLHASPEHHQQGSTVVLPEAPGTVCPGNPATGVIRSCQFPGLDACLFVLGFSFSLSVSLSLSLSVCCLFLSAFLSLSLSLCPSSLLYLSLSLSLSLSRPLSLSLSRSPVSFLSILCVFIYIYIYMYTCINNLSLSLFLSLSLYSSLCFYLCLPPFASGFFAESLTMRQIFSKAFPVLGQVVVTVSSQKDPTRLFAKL